MSAVTMGGCLCGAVRYAARAEPVVTRVCWCRVCQFVGAGSGTVNVAFPAEAVTITGELREYESTADSGNVLRRGFCPVCGTPVTSRPAAGGKVIMVRAGTLDDAEVAKPAVTIWTAAAPSWACLAESVPSVEKQPPPLA